MSKHESRELIVEMSKLKREIAAEKTEIDLLNSDWSLLTSPDRLEILAKRHGEALGLVPVEPVQLADPATLPPMKHELIKDDKGALRDAKTISDVITGSVEGQAE